MKVAASMSVGRLAPKHSLDIDGIRARFAALSEEKTEDADKLPRPRLSRTMWSSSTD